MYAGNSQLHSQYQQHEQSQEKNDNLSRILAAIHIHLDELEEGGKKRARERGRMKEKRMRVKTKKERTVKTEKERGREKESEREGD